MSGSEHALADPYRFHFLPKWWKADHPLPGPLVRFWNRQDPRATLFYRQLSEATAWTTEDLVVELESHVTSDWVRCHDAASGQPLEFRVNLRQAGFLGSLEGRAVNGRWPEGWHVDPSALRECLPKLLAWLKQDTTQPDNVTCRKPARKADIDARVAREGLPLPGDVPSFLRITDGLDIGDLAVLGCGDLHVVELDDRQYWLVAVELADTKDRSLGR